jgi:hypothetical protein
MRTLHASQWPKKKIPSETMQNPVCDQCKTSQEAIILATVLTSAPQ